MKSSQATAQSPSAKCKRLNLGTRCSQRPRMHQGETRRCSHMRTTSNAVKGAPGPETEGKGNKGSREAGSRNQSWPEAGPAQHKAAPLPSREPALQAAGSWPHLSSVPRTPCSLWRGETALQMKQKWQTHLKYFSSLILVLYKKNWTQSSLAHPRGQMVQRYLLMDKHLQKNVYSSEPNSSV